MNDGKEKEVAVQELLDDISKSFLYRSRMWKRKIYFCQTSMQRLSRFLLEKNNNPECKNSGLDSLIKSEIEILNPRLENIRYSL